jgi:outer membrane protein OmpA-like peptidoglycan-associated protein
VRSHAITRSIAAVVSLVAALGLAVALAACSKGPDLTRAKAAAFELLGSYGPKVSGLIGRHADLKSRLTAVSGGADAATVAELARKLDEQHAAIATLKGLLDGYAATIEQAGKTGGKAGIEQAMATFDGALKTGVDAVKAKLAEAATAIAALEDAAKATAAANAPVVTPIEDQLKAFLADPAKQPDETLWLTLDRVTFATGNAAWGGLGAKEQLDAIAQVMAAFPKAKLAIGGRREPGEDARLAKQRAEAVRKTLVAAKLGEARLAAEALAPACAANDTEDCRAQNRRVAVRVTAK